MKQAAELAVMEKNDAGGIFGVIVEAETKDDEDEVEEAKAAARAFCDRVDLLGVVGHYNSDTSGPAAAICENCTLL